MTTVKFTLPDRLAKKLPKQERLRQKIVILGLTHYRVEGALRRYKKGKATLAQAAETAGISLRKIIPLAYAYGLEPKFDEALVMHKLTPEQALQL